MGVTLNFDATNIKPLGEMEAIPAGTYTVCITASEAKPTKAGDGSYLELEFTVMEGDYKDRKVFTNLNIGNKNPTAVEIAYRALSSICHAVGVIQVADSSQLHNKPFLLKVGVRPAGQGADGRQYEASNEIKGYKSLAEASTSAAPITPPAPAVAAAPAFAPPAFVPPAAPAPAAPANPAFSFPAGTPPTPAAAAPAPTAPVPPWLQPKA